VPQTTTSAVSVFNTATGAASASNASVGPAPTGQTIWISGISITGAGATAAGSVTATLVGTIFGTLSFVVGVPTLGSGAVSLVIPFYPPVPVILGNVATLNVPSFGAGSTGQSAAIWGFSSQS